MRHLYGFEDNLLVDQYISTLYQFTMQCLSANQKNILKETFLSQMWARLTFENIQLKQGDVRKILDMACSVIMSFINANIIV